MSDHIDHDDDVMDMAGYSYPAIVHEYEAAWARIKTKKECFIDKKPLGFAINSERILETAGNLYQPGDVASPIAISRILDLSRQYTQNIIFKLKQEGRWMYKGGYSGNGRKKISFGVTAEPAK